MTGRVHPESGARECIHARTEENAFASLMKRILWMLFLDYLILAVMGFIFGRQVGYRDAFAVCPGISAFATTAFACLYLLNLVWTAIERKREMSRHAHR